MVEKARLIWPGLAARRSKEGEVVVAAGVVMLVFCEGKGAGKERVVGKGMASSARRRSRFGLGNMMVGFGGIG